MRASSVFILALALLVGLAVAAGAKSAGLFDKKAPPPAPEKAAPAKALVAKVSLFEGVTVTAEQVRVRDLLPEEEARLTDRFGKNWKEKVMPPTTAAAHLRTVNLGVNIPAESILLRDYFAEAGLPDRLTAQLEPNTQAVNVSVLKDKAAGGVLRVGEHVDVLLTTKVASGGREDLRTATIARACKVVMKRNNPWAVMIADPDDKPLHFTLQANPYRAALIEFAQTHGQLTLLPVPTPARTSAGAVGTDPNSREFANEDTRVDKYRNGQPIGSEDLVRIFQVTPPPARQPAPPPFRVEHLSGVAPAGQTVLPGQGAPATVPAAAPASPVQPAGGLSDAAAPAGDQPEGFTFKLPSATGDEGCKDCKEKQRKAAEDAKYKTVRPN